MIYNFKFFSIWPSRYLYVSLASGFIWGSFSVILCSCGFCGWNRPGICYEANSGKIKSISRIVGQMRRSTQQPNVLSSVSIQHSSLSCVYIEHSFYILSLTLFSGVINIALIRCTKAICNVEWVLYSFNEFHCNIACWVLWQHNILRYIPRQCCV